VEALLSAPDKLGPVELLVLLELQAIRVLLAMLEQSEMLGLLEILEHLELEPQQEMLEEQTLGMQERPETPEVVVLP
jgi:hypothetical protein